MIFSFWEQNTFTSPTKKNPLPKSLLPPKTLKPTGIILENETDLSMVRAKTVEIEKKLKKLFDGKISNKSTLGSLFKIFADEYPKMATQQWQDDTFYIKSERNDLFHTHKKKLDDRTKFVKSAKQVMEKLDSLEMLIKDVKMKKEEYEKANKKLEYYKSKN